MFTEKILQITDKPVVLAEQKMTVPTERLIRALKVSEILNLDLVNLTYLGAPFIDPKRGDFDLLKPRILTAEGMIRPQIGRNRAGQIGDLVTSEGLSLAEYYKWLSSLRASDPALSIQQIEWLLDPVEFDMTDFYLESSGRIEPTRDSISAKYLPAYYEELAKTQIPLIADLNRKSKRSKDLINNFGVIIIDLEDLIPDLDGQVSLPKEDFSQRSYVDLSLTTNGGIYV